MNPRSRFRPQRTLLALLAVLTLGLLSSGVRAAGEPGIFGNLDLSALYSSTGHGGTQRSAIESGAHDGSFIGWRLREPLAPGYSALVTLAYGLALDNNSGIGSVQFGSGSRSYQSSVGLATPFGEFKVGRMSSPVNAIKRFDPLLGNKFSALASLLPMAINLAADPTRFSNALAYASPVAAGWQAQALYAFAPYAGDTAADGSQQERAAVATLHYTGAHVSAIIGHQTTTHLGGGLAAGAVRVSDSSLAAAWDFDAVRLMAIGLRSERQQPGSRRLIDHAELGVLWHIGAQDDLGVQLARLHEHDREAADAQSVALHYDHFLSKRTTLYAGYNLTRNDANARHAADQFNRPVAGTAARLLGAGIQHTF